MSRKDHFHKPDDRLESRLTELSVHMACGKLHGPTPADHQFRDVLPWQSCRCEDQPASSGLDVDEVLGLCVLCGRGIAETGPTRFSWFACQTCKSANNTLKDVWGVRPFALGRHSLMNGNAIKSGASQAEVCEGVGMLMAHIHGFRELDQWHKREWQRVAGQARDLFGGVEDVPLSRWRAELPESLEASADAMGRFLGRDDVLEALTGW